MTREWRHHPPDDHDGTPREPQSVDVLGWTQHGAIVIATEPGWLPEDEPVFVRMAELELVR
jgi:hypothetical protein